MNFLSITGWAVQCMGPFFGFPPLKISRPLHKIIRAERVEGIRQLVRKTVKSVLYTFAFR
jgi:hypothetical protein